MSTNNWLPRRYCSGGGRWPVPRSRSSSASQTRHRVSTCIAVIDICVPRERSISGTGWATTSVDPQRSQCGAAGRSQLNEHPPHVIVMTASLRSPERCSSVSQFGQLMSSDIPERLGNVSSDPVSVSRQRCERSNHSCGDGEHYDESCSTRVRASPISKHREHKWSNSGGGHQHRCHSSTPCAECFTADPSSKKSALARCD